MSIGEFLKRLFSTGSPQATKAQSGVADIGDAVVATVECSQCGERIDVRMRKSSDIQRNYEGGDFVHFVQKTVVGTSCFNRIDMRLEFDGRYRLVGADIKGGKLATEETSP